MSGTVDAVITGVHAVVYSDQAQATRDFFADVLGWDAVDAGGGWLIFASPPAELAVHPAEDPGRHELYLMCDDLDATIEELQAKGVEVVGQTSQERWGRVTAIALPGGGRLGLYEPSHPSPPRLT
jgi:predicted enzyme related to lactoylglutathione lyase